jgi:hypothetical protein
MSDEAAAQSNNDAASTDANDQTSVLGDDKATDTDKSVLGDDKAKDGSNDDVKDTDKDDSDKDDPDKDKDDKPEGAPEKYEFVMPEGVEMDEAAMGEFEPIMRELDLPTEKAQKLVDAYAKVQQAQQDGITQFYADQKAEAMKIPAAEIGLAKTALNLFPEEAEAIKADVYMRDNPAVIRLLSKFGKLASEAGNREAGDKKSTGPATFDEAADSMFTNPSS